MSELDDAFERLFSGHAKISRMLHKELMSEDVANRVSVGIEEMITITKGGQTSDYAPCIVLSFRIIPSDGMNIDLLWEHIKRYSLFIDENHQPPSLSEIMEGRKACIAE